MTDPISDMIIRIKNAQAVNQPTVDLPYSNLKNRLVSILAERGFIKKIEKKYSKTKKIIRITLKYEDKTPAIQEFKRISKPGKRIYVSFDEIRVPRGGGIMIISTSKGLMTGREARKQRLGGEAIFEVW